MLSRKRILMITGAGLSGSFGLPSVAEINKLYEKHSLEFAEGVPEKSPVHIVKKLLNQHSVYEREPFFSTEDKAVNLSKHYEANFESIQYALNLISSVEPQIPLIDCGKTYIGDHFPIHKLLCKNEFLSQFDPCQLYWLQLSLRYQVYKLFVENMNEIKQNELYRDFQRLLQRIRKKYDISIATLNYDDLLLRMLPNLKNGFDRRSGLFRPERLFDNHWDTHLHLHGSIHFRSSKKRENEWVSKPSIDTTLFEFGKELRTDEGIIVNTFPMIIGYDKPDAILCNPYRLYFSVLERQIYEADIIVIVGYGFGDLHLNRYLSAIRYYRSQHKTILIVDYKEKDYSLNNMDPWSRAVRTIFQVNKCLMPIHIGENINQCIEHREKNTKLLIWTHGINSLVMDSNDIPYKLAL